MTALFLPRRWSWCLRRTPDGVFRASGCQWRLGAKANAIQIESRITAIDVAFDMLCGFTYCEGNPRETVFDVVDRQWCQQRGAGASG